VDSQALVAADEVQEPAPAFRERAVDHPAERRVVRQADVLEHADRDEYVGGAPFVSTVRSDTGTGVRAPQKSGGLERPKDRLARGGIEVPEALKLRFRQMQAGDLVVLRANELEPIGDRIFAPHGANRAVPPASPRLGMDPPESFYASVGSDGAFDCGRIFPPNRCPGALRLSTTQSLYADFLSN
jgi:hypothetical protein